ncbi:unnamed protein product [Parnassius mnemosyne]|uniref:DNA helicase Pif1-like 2B domain-containing protein n=1 Tax=Parnassius mnemosyne TaxID=213953 RepID=A0AAV1LX39_9NEOP
MRVHSGEKESASGFANLLLEIGNGDYPINDGMITIPDNLCTVVFTLQELISKIYPYIAHIHDKLMKWLCERAILTPKNDKAAVINDILLTSFEGDEMVYTSIDSVVNTDDAINYPVKFLNSLKPSSLPHHELILRVGTPVMLLRNL